MGVMQMRQDLSVRNMDTDAIEMLRELREVERRFVGAILSEAIRSYHGMVFDEYDDLCDQQSIAVAA